jgi:hypothetical protein
MALGGRLAYMYKRSHRYKNTHTQALSTTFRLVFDWAAGVITLAGARRGRFFGAGSCGASAPAPGRKEGSEGSEGNKEAKEGRMGRKGRKEGRKGRREGMKEGRRQEGREGKGKKEEREGRMEC